MKIKIDSLRAESPTGTKIHYVAIRPIGNRYTLLCTPVDFLNRDELNCGLGWEPTRKPVTCKHCLRRIKYYEDTGSIKEN